MRTLVTGGAGFIGSTLVDRLLVEGHEVDVIDDLSTGSLANLAHARGSAGRALTIHQVDITAPAVVELVARRRPELVFHLAAQADVRVSVARPVFDAETNIVGSLNVLEGARRAETERVVFAASGGTLYGEPSPEDFPVREADPHQPLSPYGVSKKAVLDYLVAYRELHALEFSALALANVYGPRQDPHGEAGVVAIFAQRLLAAEPVTIFGDGDQTRDFVFVDDVVDAFVRAASRGGGLICNIGTGQRPRSTTSTGPWPSRRAWTPRRFWPRFDPESCFVPVWTSSGPPSSSGGAPGRRWSTAPAPSSSSCEANPAELPAAPAAPAAPALQPRLAARPPNDAAPQLTEEVLVRGPDDLLAHRRRPQPCPGHAADDGRRNAPVLAHDEFGRRANSSPTHNSVATSSRPLASRRATEVDHRRHPGAADGDIGHPAPPGAPKGVGDDHADVDAAELFEAGPDTTSRSVRVFGQEGCVPSAHVGQIDARIGADEAVLGLADDEVAVAPENANRLLLNQGGLGRGIVEVDGHDLPFGLGHHLLGDHNHIARLQGGAAGVARRQHLGHHQGQVRSRLDLADAGQRDEGDPTIHAASITRRASASARAGVSMMVGATRQRTPSASTAATWARSASSTTRVPTHGA